MMDPRFYAKGLNISKNWRWEEHTNQLIDIRSDPEVRYPVSSFDAKVYVYEDRVREWFLNLAHENVNRDDYCGLYVALSVALSYIEGVEQYRRGRTTPQYEAGNWFKASAQRVFPAIPQEAVNRLWTEARCGLFHSGFTDGQVYLSPDYPQSLSIDNGRLNINPRLFVEAVCADFASYLAELRASRAGDLHRNFEELWDSRWESS